MKYLAIAAGFSLSALCAAPAAAQNAPELKPLSAAMASGTYAGTFLCSLGEMGMTLTIEDTGPAGPVNINDEPCRSGLGPCNDAQNAKLKDLRGAEGILNFFPLMGNPDAPKGAFKVSGTINYGMAKHWRINLSPGEWIEKPDNFGSSALQATIYNGQMTGKPTATGCHRMQMTKIRTGS